MQARAFQNVFAQLAAQRVPVLISGEPGVGKRAMVARICAVALPQGTEFIELDCSVSDDAALAMALRGLRNGDTPCTLCLLRVDAMTASAQRMLLLELDRILESGRVFLVCIANLDVEVEVLSGQFREDLYYRISPVTIRVAPLRHRKGEIAILADGFLAGYATMFGRPKPPLDSRLLRFLNEYTWPGNLPELENAMRTVAAVGDPLVAMAALSATNDIHRKRRGSGNGNPISLKQAAKAASSRAERELILSSLVNTNWNRKKTAEQLQISYKALLYKMKRIGVLPGTDVRQEVTE